MLDVSIIPFTSVLSVLCDKSVVYAFEWRMSLQDQRDRLRVLPCLPGVSCSLSLSVHALAQSEGMTDYFEELPVALTASRRQQTPAQAPAAIGIIDRAMTQASGARRLWAVQPDYRG